MISKQESPGGHPYPSQPNEELPSIIDYPQTYVPVFLDHYQYISLEQKYLVLDVETLFSLDGEDPSQISYSQPETEADREYAIHAAANFCQILILPKEAWQHVRHHVDDSLRFSQGATKMLLRNIQAEKYIYTSCHLWIQVYLDKQLFRSMITIKSPCPYKAATLHVLPFYASIAFELQGFLHG